MSLETYGGKVLPNYKYKSIQPSIHTGGTRTGGKGNGKVDKYSDPSIFNTI